MACMKVNYLKCFLFKTFRKTEVKHKDVMREKHHDGLLYIRSDGNFFFQEQSQSREMMLISNLILGIPSCVLLCC